MRALLLTLLIFLLAACASSIPTPTLTPVPTIHPTPTMPSACAAGLHVETLLSAGEVRQYRLYVPRVYQPDLPAALVLGFHGNNSRAEYFEPYSGFSELAENEGFLVVYPQGAGEHPTWETEPGSKDVQFVRDLISHLQTICSINPAHIYATGHSLGGGMVNRLACDLADIIAAIGPVAGAYRHASQCTPSQPVSVLAVHGTADDVIYYQGIPPGGRMPEAYTVIGTPIPSWASSWAGRNGCDARAEIIFRQDPVSAQGWSRCQNGADVVLYTIRDGGHGWPNPADGFDTAQVIWDFFVEHSLMPPV